MNCPKCAGKDLEHLSVDVKNPDGGDAKIDLDRCGGCGGTWFDPGEIEQYLKSRQSDAPSVGLASIFGQANDSKAGNCPRCSVALKRTASAANATISVDRCEKCNGVWFDGGELQQAGKKAADISGQLKDFFG